MAKKRKAQQGGLQITGGVKISGGDFIAGDKVSVDNGGIYVGGDVNEANFVAGNDNRVGNLAATRRALFQDVMKKIDGRPDTAPADKEKLKNDVQALQTEAAKGDRADEDFLSLRLHNIERIAPDIAEVVLATLANPAAGCALIVKKVAERASKQTRL